MVGSRRIQPANQGDYWCDKINRAGLESSSNLFFSKQSRKRKRYMSINFIKSLLFKGNNFHHLANHRLVNFF